MIDDRFPEDDFETSFNIDELEMAFEPDADLSAEDYDNHQERSLRPDCEAFFAPGGPLKAAAAEGGRPYEFRPQQIQMSGAIADALAQGQNLRIEAPTGVGKSFAYLIPLIFRAKIASRPAIVSTETINLQEQLIHKDIPLLKKITGIDFKAALAKGRRNYLCRRRYSLLSADQKDALLPSPEMALEVQRLSVWIDKTDDGNRDSLEFRVDPATWDLVACEAHNCMGPKCPFYRNCFYYKARQEWETADIVVANHALFFTDLAMRCCNENAGALLPNYGAVLIDEAHTLENNAAEYLGLHLSRAGIVGTLNRLFNPENARGLLMRQGEASMELRAMVADTRGEAYGFFANYEEYINRREETAVIIREPQNFPDNLSRKLQQLYFELSKYADDIEEAGLKTEFEAQLSNCMEYVSGIDQFTNQTIPDAVYYAESERGGVRLHASPLNVAEILSEVLFNQDFPVILCSATLTVSNRFDYFCGRTGFCNGSTLLLDSPFRKEQAKLLIPRIMPDPSMAEEYQTAVNREIPRFLRMTDGKAFVLFTSYKMLRGAALALRTPCMLNNWQMLIQGETLTRSMMLKEFVNDPNSILLGTDSFWTGVDVPGEALSNVIITKLPFASPGHPLIAAREERIRNRGGSPFFEYDLPEAVLKFRQGVGRLIRSRTDSGIIVLLDRRVITKRYGKMFLDSIPYQFELI